jgi:hypothetical protein
MMLINERDFSLKEGALDHYEAQRCWNAGPRKEGEDGERFMLACAIEFEC